ncbi:MAG: hypothetical protein WCQ44_08395, partial [Opitutaceae bacterium]
MKLYLPMQIKSGLILDLLQDKMKSLFKYFFALVFLLFNLSIKAKTIYYVKINGTGDGSSWINADNNIQAMIDKALVGDEVWVSSGTYFPTTEMIGRNARSRTFLMKDGVNLYGGFSGSETTISQRALSDINADGKIDSWEFTNTSLLSGDIDGVSDIWTKSTNTNGKTWAWTVSGNEGNCYRVVTCQTNFVNQTIFNGFSVNGGNANVTNYTSGGGILTISNFSIQKCTIKNCFASTDGGAVNGNILNCSIDSCSAGSNGGGIIGNATNCTIENCSSIKDGGGIYGDATNCKISYCSSANYGGGIQTVLKANNCNVDNCSAYYGGGICSYDSVNNCIVNSCVSLFVGGGIYSKYVTNCSVSNCSSSHGGGVASASVLNCIINNCLASTDGGGINCDYSSFYSISSSVINCKVDNCKSVNGAGIYSSSYSNYSTSVKKCSVSNCTATNKGGGIYSAYTANSGGTSSSASVTNCLVINCSANSYGGGVFSSSQSASSIYFSYAFVANCTVVNCTAANNGGIFDTSNLSNSIVTNCIVQNCTGSGSNTAIDIKNAFIKPTSFVGIAITDVQKAELLASDWHLCEGSPYINVGDLTYLSSDFLLNNDLDQKSRVQYGKIDFGAYEYSFPIINMPVFENFDDWTDFENSNNIYNSATINGNRNIKWVIKNKKAVFNFETNLTSSYDQPFFTYSINATQSNTVFLKYDMYYEAYSGTIAQLGTEKLAVEISTNFIDWTSVASYSNINGTIQNMTYLHDISSLVAGKVFYVRFRAFGVNANNIEKWEIDN